jgi:hypothetical protein
MTAGGSSFDLFVGFFRWLSVTVDGSAMAVDDSAMGVDGFVDGSAMGVAGGWLWVTADGCR